MHGRHLQFIQAMFDLKIVGTIPWHYVKDNRTLVLKLLFICTCTVLMPSSNEIMEVICHP